MAMLDHPFCTNLLDSFVYEGDDSGGQQSYINLVMDFVPQDMATVLASMNE